ncbi:MAG: glycosyltransferase [Thermoguttaceae bacterium]
MEAFGWALYLIISSVAIVQSLLMCLQAWEHRRYVRSCMRGLDRYQPSGRVLVCAPCKGCDLRLEDNLRAVLEQDYDDYEVAFIVEDEADSACPIIRRAMADHQWLHTRLIVAGRATSGGQKTHNLRAATKRLSPRIKYVAFLDSDARARPEWLRMLISRLDRSNVGAATGYRWFVPQSNTAGNNLLYGINSNLISMLGKSSHKLVWGGSWAIGRELFEQLDLRSAWRDTLSDDFVAQRLLSKTKLQVRFIPPSVVESPIDYTFCGAISFLRRQYLLGRFYARDWWLFAALTATFGNLVWLGNASMFICGLLKGASWSWAPGAMLLILYLLTVFRGLVRRDLAALYFPHLRRCLRGSSKSDIWLQPLIGVIHNLVVWSSAVGRNISWRGINYLLARDGKIERSWREEDAAALPMPCLAADNSKFSGEVTGRQKTG